MSVAIGYEYLNPTLSDNYIPRFKFHTKYFEHFGGHNTVALPTGRYCIAPLCDQTGLNQPGLVIRLHVALNMFVVYTVCGFIRLTVGSYMYIVLVSGLITTIS